MPTLNPSYVAALALVGIQVGVGLIYKFAQQDGGYTFSTPSSIAISEFLKLLLSTTFFYHECTRRYARSRAGYYSSLPTSERACLNENDVFKHDDIHTEAWTSRANDKKEKDPVVLSRLSISTFLEYCRNELPEETLFGFAHLALLYAVINNTAFALYKIADPGTISLIKSSITLVTALLTRFTLGTKVAKLQWVAILVQICGIVVTQYRPGTGSSYPIYTYCLLFFQVFLSATSGVYNQSLCKSRNVSLHAGNMTLYAAGSAINFILHLVIRTLKADTPSFFSGYESFGAKMVIASNVLVGLAITAVYRYADAVIKCFATSVSTGVLLYVSPIFFNVELSFMVIPGTVLVFLATWLYMEVAPPKQMKEKGGYDHSPAMKRVQGAWTLCFARATLTAGMIMTTIVVAILTITDARMPGLEQSKNGKDVKTLEKSSQVLESPFKNSLAYIRWASERPERMPLLRSYAPFFHDLHFSMPGYVKNEPVDFLNLTHDSHESPDVIFYAPLADTMQVILTAPASSPEASIDGVLNFHFDAWIDPLSFANENLNLIQYATSPSPRLQCMKTLSRYPDYWGWDPTHLFHEQARSAIRALKSLDLGYDVDLDEWCVGWSDIFYIPRRFFVDFIYLSRVFASFHSFHEVAVPTIVNIIDRTYRRQGHATRSVVNHIGDCYGSCCSPGATIDDVLEKRCGHRLDYGGDATVIAAAYDRLDREAAMLGSRLEGDPRMACEMFGPSAGNGLDMEMLGMIDRKMGDMRAKGKTQKAEGLDAIDRSTHG